MGDLSGCSTSPCTLFLSCKMEMITIPLHSFKTNGWQMWVGFVTTHAFIHTLISDMDVLLEDDRAIKPFSTLVFME